MYYLLGGWEDITDINKLYARDCTCSEKEAQAIDSKVDDLTLI